MCSLSVPSSRGFSLNFKVPSPILGSVDWNKRSLPPVGSNRCRATARAVPVHTELHSVCVNMLAKLSSRASTTLRESYELQIPIYKMIMKE